jgi:hypothetical protein
VVLVHTQIFDFFLKEKAHLQLLDLAVELPTCE